MLRLISVTLWRFKIENYECANDILRNRRAARSFSHRSNCLQQYGHWLDIAPLYSPQATWGLRSACRPAYM